MTATATTTPAPSKASGAPQTRQRPRRAGAPAAWPRVLAALHSQGASLRIVLARQDGPGAPPFVIEALTLPTADTAQLLALLARHKPAEVVRLVPSSATVARCVAPPVGLSADRAQAAAVLALVAESELPSLIPAHRRAAGFVRPGPEASGDAVLVVGWPERPEPAPAPLPIKDEAWTPELVALAALAHALGGAELALYADRGAGSIALIASSRPHTPGTMNGTSGASAVKTVARVLRADVTSDATWRASLQNAVAETAASLSIPVAPLDLGAGAPASLILLGSPLRRPRGMPIDPAWLSSYGPAFGAICALTDEDPAARPLAQLRAAAPRETAGAVVRAVEWLTTPRHAVLAVIVCLALFLLWPLAVAKSREWILSTRAGGSVELDKRLREAERRVAFYKQLREKRWPMTKLIADIAGAAPEGLSLDLLTLQREQGGINVRGRAETAEHVTQFRRNLATSGVFGFLTTPTVESEGGSVVFQLEAQVVAPQFRAPLKKIVDQDGKVLYDPDFAATPLAVRMYGERARKGAHDGADTPATEAPSTGSSPRASTSGSAPRDTPRDRPRNGGNRGGSLRGDSGAREDSGTSSRRSAGSSTIPEPVSDADIQKMDKGTALKEWTARRKASSLPDLDADTKRRLAEESDKCKSRYQELNK